MPIYGLAPRKATEAIFEYALVKIISDAGVELLDGAVGTDFAWGVAQRAVPIGEPVEVETRHGYVTRLHASAAFAAGTRLMVGSGADAGKVLTSTGTKFTCAIAHEASTGPGHIIKGVLVLETIALP